MNNKNGYASHVHVYLMFSEAWYNSEWILFLWCNMFSFHKGMMTFLVFWYNFITLKISCHDFSIHASFLLAMPAVLLFVVQDPLGLWSKYNSNTENLPVLFMAKYTHHYSHRDRGKSFKVKGSERSLWTLATFFLIDSGIFFCLSHSDSSRVSLKKWQGLKIKWWSHCFTASFNSDILYKNVSPGPEELSFLFISSSKWLAIPSVSHILSSSLCSYREGYSVHSLCCLPFCSTSCLFSSSIL